MTSHTRLHEDFIEAMFIGDIKRMKQLFEEHQFNPNELSSRRYFGAMHCAAMNNCIPSFEYLYRKGAKVDIVTDDESRYTPLMIATRHSKKEAIQWLLDHDADFLYATHNETALDMAIQRNQSPCLQILQPYYNIYPHQSAVVKICMNESNEKKHSDNETDLLPYDIIDLTKSFVPIRQQWVAMDRDNDYLAQARIANESLIS